MQTSRVVGAGAGLVVLVLITSGVAFGVSALTPQSVGANGKTTGGCPSSNAIANFVPSTEVGASWTPTGSTWTLSFSSYHNLNSTKGVPGLIEYCVYPASGSLPPSMSVSAIGADGSSFLALSGSHQGYFGFGRSTGDPSNIPLDGTQNVLMGSASWTGSAPSNATILLHINDASECQALYGGSSNTCFVLPSPPPVAPCGGNPACKTALVAEASSATPEMVPSNTQLHVHYTYTISNAWSNGFDMQIVFPGSRSSSFTGVRDFFNCTQAPDANGLPGAVGNYSDYQSTGLRVVLHWLNERGVCVNLVLTAVASSTTITLHPGQSITWTLDTVTGPSGFSGRGWHCLNEGVQLSWLQSNDGLVHHYQSPDVDVWTAN